MNEDVKSYLDQRFEGLATKNDLADLRDAVATKADLVNLATDVVALSERIENLDEDIAALGKTTALVLDAIQGQVDEQGEIVSDAGLGGRVGRLETQMKQVVQKVAI